MHFRRQIRRTISKAAPENRVLFSVLAKSPRAGRDKLQSVSIAQGQIFQPTCPAWGETHPHAPVDLPRRISIHSPRVGRDPDSANLSPAVVKFQSTRPAWGETWSRPCCGY